MPKLINMLPCIAIAACVSPDAQMDLMKGAGSYGPANVWSYVFPENAYASVIDDAAQLRQQHQLMIAKWLAQERRCEGGHRITDRNVQNGMIVYNGVCK